MPEAEVALMAEILKRILEACRRRIRSWRVPPNWSSVDWFEEIEAVEAVAAWQADCAYKASSGIKREAYVYQQVMARALTRYRQEWMYALRFISKEECLYSSNGASDLASSDTENFPTCVTCSCPTIVVDLTDALKTLPEAQQQLIKELFWFGHTEAEIGEALGISQRAVSKRKLLIFKRLHNQLSPNRAIRQKF